MNCLKNGGKLCVRAAQLKGATVPYELGFWSLKLVFSEQEYLWKTLHLRYGFNHADATPFALWVGVAWLFLACGSCNSGSFGIKIYFNSQKKNLWKVSSSAYTSFLRDWPDPKYGGMTSELMTINTATGQNFDAMLYFRPGWSSFDSFDHRV